MKEGHAINNSIGIPEDSEKATEIMHEHLTGEFKNPFTYKEEKEKTVKQQEIISTTLYYRCFKIRT